MIMVVVGTELNCTSKKSACVQILVVCTWLETTWLNENQSILLLFSFSCHPFCHWLLMTWLLCTQKKIYGIINESYSQIKQHNIFYWFCMLLCNMSDFVYTGNHYKFGCIHQGARVTPGVIRHHYWFCMRHGKLEGGRR